MLRALTFLILAAFGIAAEHHGGAQISCPMVAWSSLTGLSGASEQQHAQSLQVLPLLQMLWCLVVCFEAGIAHLHSLLLQIHSSLQDALQQLLKGIQSDEGADVVLAVLGDQVRCA